MIKKLRQNKKGGVSVAIAILLGMVILMGIVTQIFLWEQTLRNEERKRINEKIEIRVAWILNSTLYIGIENIGSLTTHLVALWHGEVRTPISIYLNTETSETIGVATNKTVADDFDITVITERGNKAVKSYKSIEETHDVSESGVFKIDWFFCQYTSEQNQNQSNAFAIARNENYVAFYLKITNNYDREATIRKESLLGLISDEGNEMFYIIKNVSYSTSTPSIEVFESISVNPQEQIELVFSAEGISGDSVKQYKWKWGEKSHSLGTNGIQISLFYEMMNDDTTISIFGQTISTQAVFVYNP